MRSFSRASRSLVSFAASLAASFEDKTAALPELAEDAEAEAVAGAGDEWSEKEGDNWEEVMGEGAEAMNEKAEDEEEAVESDADELAASASASIWARCSLTRACRFSHSARSAALSEFESRSVRSRDSTSRSSSARRRVISSCVAWRCSSVTRSAAISFSSRLRMILSRSRRSDSGSSLAEFPDLPLPPLASMTPTIDFIWLRNAMPWLK